MREQFPDIRMRIYNRDGEVQYDSTLAQDIERKPSLALIEAREQSLFQDSKLNKLNQSYEASIQQGRNLPQVLAENPNVDNALIPKHIEERTKLNAQGYLEQAGAEVHQQYRVVQIQQQMNDPNVQRIGGIERTELAQTYDELIKAHQYSPEKALEAVNARVTFNTEIEDIKAGKTINLTEDGVRSHAIVRQTATVIQDSPLRQQLDHELTASYRIMNQATPGLVHHALHPTPSTPHPPTPFQQAYRSAGVELEQTTQRPHNILTRQTSVISIIYAKGIEIGEKTFKIWLLALGMGENASGLRMIY